MDQFPCDQTCRYKMSQLHILSENERKEFFEVAAAKLNMNIPIVEKDYWVVFMLEKLFAIDELKNHLTFKGGTSLSKVYKLIERFSEDVDVSIEKEYFGFTGDKDPEKIDGANNKKKALEAIGKACGEYVETRMLGQLQSNIEKSLGTKIGWSIYVDPDDHQTLQFEYPSLSPQNGYIKRAVKIEVGARSEHWPVSNQSVQSYVKEALPDQATEKAVIVKVLNAERTFWEKATILHQYAHMPDDKKLKLRISRHYYDFYCLLNSDVKNKAAADHELLQRVSEHKKIYFPVGWASYETAKAGSLKLSPPERVRAELKRDYQLMNEMFYGHVPKFEDVLNVISEFEKKFNRQ